MELLVLTLDMLLVPFLQLFQIVQGLVASKVMGRRHPALMDYVFEVEDGARSVRLCDLGDRLTLHSMHVGFDLLCYHLVLERSYRPIVAQVDAGLLEQRCDDVQDALRPLARQTQLLGVSDLGHRESLVNEGVLDMRNNYVVI